MIDHHIKETQEKLMRLHPRTPQCVVSFLAGCLPGRALLHQKILSIFGMICVLKDSILHCHAKQVLVNAKPSSRSWFVGVRDICLQYGLPHPLELLNSERTKENIKSQVKKHIVDFWERKLRADAATLSSLEYFHPQYMSLTSAHPIWTTAGPNPYQVMMSTIQATMISGRYRTEELCSNWSPPSSGCCLTPLCIEQSMQENLHHILVTCASLEPTRERLLKFTRYISEQQPPHVQELIGRYCNPTSLLFLQFLLDCSTIPEVISTTQEHGQAILCPLFRITRTWV